MQIHGVVITRNEWGILALSICNAFNHVDVIHVLNHGSNDQTSHGLEIFKKIWADKLKVYTSSPDVPWEQSLLTNMIVSIAEVEGADWIYVFDSDEFLLSRKNFSLREELSKLNESEMGLRYSVNNYISTYDFDENNLNCYKKLIYKSKPSAKYDSVYAIKSINAGKSSFFDQPFYPKIVFRANKNLLIGKGAHVLKLINNKESIKNLVLSDCAHLSLISKNKLYQKSMHGKSLIDLGLPLEIGWQDQLIHHLDIEGRLDWFWERHSIQPENSRNFNPSYIIDKSLVECLSNSIEVLKEKFGGENLSMLFGVPLSSGYAKQTNFTFDSIFHICKFFNKKVDLFLHLQKRK